MSNILNLENEKTISLDSFDEVREMLKNDQVDWLIVTYQAGGEVQSRIWTEDLTPLQSCTIQGALMGVRDHVAAITEEE